MSKIIKLETSVNNWEKAKLKLIQWWKKMALKENFSSTEVAKERQIFKWIIICANKPNLTVKEIKHECENECWEDIFEEYEWHKNTISDLYRTLLAA